MGQTLDTRGLAGQARLAPLSFRTAPALPVPGRFPLLLRSLRAASRTGQLGRSGQFGRSMAGSHLCIIRMCD